MTCGRPGDSGAVTKAFREPHLGMDCPLRMSSKIRIFPHFIQRRIQHAAVVIGLTTDIQNILSSRRTPAQLISVKTPTIRFHLIAFAYRGVRWLTIYTQVDTTNPLELHANHIRKLCGS